jgi:hypothetical protein
VPATQARASQSRMWSPRSCPGHVLRRRRRPAHWPMVPPARRQAPASPRRPLPAPRTQHTPAQADAPEPARACLAGAGRPDAEPWFLEVPRAAPRSNASSRRPRDIARRPGSPAFISGPPLASISAPAASDNQYRGPASAFAQSARTHDLYSSRRTRSIRSSACRDRPSQSDHLSVERYSLDRLTNSGCLQAWRVRS